MLRKLAEVRPRRNQHRALCQWAYEYSKHTDFKHLDEKCASEPKIPVYHQIRHYIGRLGSWHRAALALVHAAVEIPIHIASLSVEFVPPQPTCWSSTVEVVRLRELIETLDIGLNIDYVLQHLQIFYSQTSQRRENLTDNLQQAFAAQLTRPQFRPIVHAEVLLADYVFAGRLRFIMDDRYIGCSKPACVLCRLYLEEHPLQVASPPCHGNLWPQWSPPLLNSGRPSEHVEDLTEIITIRLRTFLRDRLIHGQTDFSRLPDSMTGITPRTKSDINNPTRQANHQ